MSEEQNDTLELPKQEAEEFVVRILEESLPETYPPNIEWINCLIQAFQRKQPFQNITLMSQYATRHVPTWEDIYRDILQEGKGGLCLSLNFAFAAVLRSLGVCAYSAAADYVASCGRAVHAVTIIHLCTPHRMCPNCLEYAGTSGRLGCTSECQVHKSRDFPRIKNSYRHFGNREKNISKTLKMCQTSKCRKIRTFDTDMVYLADVGCGFPTLQAINLKDDLEKVYVDCGLEYCIIKKAHRYLRVHRAGDEVPEGEKECVNKDGWRPVFSFTLTPRPLSYFQQTMRSIFVNLEQSPYFTELHLVRYLNFHEMIALKNETCIESLYFHKNKKPDCNFLEGSIINTSRNWKSKKSEMKLCNESSEKKHRRNKIKLNEKEMLFFIREHFPMIPGYEAEKALHHYFSVQTKSGQ